MKQIFLNGIILVLFFNASAAAHVYDTEGLKLFINLDGSSKKNCTSNAQCGFREKCLLNNSGEGVCVEYQLNPYNSKKNSPFIFFQRENTVGSSATTQKDTLIQQSGQPAQIFSTRKDPLTNRTTVIGQQDGETKTILQGQGDADVIFYRTINPEFPLDTTSPDVYNKGRVGPVREFYANGKLKLEANYTDGKLNGTYREYFPNGQLKVFENWVAGRREGASVSYFEDGSVQFQVIYQGGVPAGPYKIYNSDGTYIIRN